jgi:hypothetical protein
MRIDEYVGVNQYHLKLSLSAIASASPMLSMLGTRTRPSATAFVRTARAARIVVPFL